MKKTRGIAAVVIVALMALTLLAGCGGEAELTGYEGKYVSVEGEMMGITLTGEDVAGWEIELKAGGKGSMEVDGTRGSMKWTLEENTINITVEGEEMSGSIDGDKIVIENVLDSGMKMTFQKQNEE